VAELITSGSNPEIKALAALHKRSAREETGTFLIEGRREIERAHAGGFELIKVVRRDGTEPVAVDVEELVVGPIAFDRIAYGRDGLVAVARIPDFSLTRLPELVLVAVGIEKPGNLGAMLRTCDAVGAGLLVADAMTDLTNPNAVRSSTGALFTVPISVATSVEAIAWLNDAGYRILVTTVEDGAAPWDVDLSGWLALAIGSEAIGLPPLWLEAASARVTLPQVGTIDSLNASVTAAVLLYESVRQRGGTIT
jgi:TrmH family RNA methyltransferase